MRRALLYLLRSRLVRGFLVQRAWLTCFASPRCISFPAGHQTPGLWKHPKDRSANYHDIEYWTELSKLLERGKFHGILCVASLPCLSRMRHRARC